MGKFKNRLYPNTVHLKSLFEDHLLSAQHVPMAHRIYKCDKRTGIIKHVFNNFLTPTYHKLPLELSHGKDRPCTPYLCLQQGMETSTTCATLFQLCDAQVYIQGQPSWSKLEDGSQTPQLEWWHGKASERQLT